MKYIFAFLILSITLSGQSDAKKLVEESIQYHDPKGNWSNFEAEIMINSIVERNGKRDSSSRALVLDIGENYFRMTQDTLIYEYPCENCERATMFNNYFRYLLGMPMKLLDDGVILSENIDIENYKGKDYQVVTVNYAPEVGTDTWKFYFDSETKELAISEFSKDGTFLSGETIELNNKTKFQDILMVGQLKWLVLPDRKFLAEENIKYSKIRNK